MQTVKSRLKESYTPATCPHCQTSIEYLPPQLSPSDDAFQVECAKCNQTWIIRPPKPKAKKGRTIGSGQYTLSQAERGIENSLNLNLNETDERPIDTSYYDVSYFSGSPLNSTDSSICSSWASL